MNDLPKVIPVPQSPSRGIFYSTLAVKNPENDPVRVGVVIDLFITTI
jgi:hypothetical protein